MALPEHRCSDTWHETVCCFFCACIWRVVKVRFVIMAILCIDTFVVQTISWYVLIIIIIRKVIESNDPFNHWVLVFMQMLRPKMDWWKTSSYDEFIFKNHLPHTVMCLWAFFVCATPMHANSFKLRNFICDYVLCCCCCLFSSAIKMIDN